MKSKKEFCPKKHQDHKEFYKLHPEYRTDYWKAYFLAHPEEDKK